MTTRPVDRLRSGKAAGAEVDQRVTVVAEGADFTAIAHALAAARGPILQRWLEVTARQPFHADRPGRAVADHIPALFDAVVLLLARAMRADQSVDAPLDDDAIVQAATTHAQVRFEQGLRSVDIVTEFRLLRQEISRSLAGQLDDEVPATDVVAGLAIVGDALDGATMVGLAALSQQIDSVREGFLAATLHDVRQPITLVEGSLYLAARWLRAAEVDTGRVREAVGDALSATTELTAMIDTMSDASRVALGELDHDPEPASLEEIVRTSIAAFGESARERVTLEVPAGRHLIGLWDAQLLRRVVANLVGNALKYSGAGGSVRVDVRPGEPGFARMSVRDDGLGMTQDEIGSVFERFVRAERVRNAGIPGLGLGLYACRGIVAAHGGSIRLHSDGHGRGTTVIVEIPLLADDPADD